jgi:DNA-binding transcriptional ArsR family regulator
MSSSPLHAAALNALGDPNRRRILEIVSAGPCPVHEIAAQLPISRPAVSRHLRLLKAAELVEDQTSGAERIYRLRPEGVAAVRAYFEQVWGEAANRFRLAADNLQPAAGTELAEPGERRR